MLLDKFVGSHLSEILLNEELKVSTFNELNDPFEGHHKIESYTPQQALQFVTRWKNHVSKHAGYEVPSENWDINCYIGAMNFLEERKNFLITTAIEAANLSFRIACFTNHKQQKTSELAQREILMWAHYANSQKGARIVFESTNKKIPGGIIKVTYNTRLPELPLDGLFTDQNSSSKPPLTAFNSKSKVWEYEDEHRLFVESKEVKRRPRKDKVLEFIPFPIQAVKIVDFGIYHSAKDRDALIRKLRADKGQHIKFRQCVRKANRYEFDFEELT